MKKVISLLLALLLCLSLCACGQNPQEDNKNNTSATQGNTSATIESNTHETQSSTKQPETVEITLDNWSEYFDLVSIYKPSTNGFGEVDSVTSYFAIALKTEYLELIDTENSEITAELFYAQGKQYGTFSDDFQSFDPNGEYDKLEGHDRTEVHTLGLTDYGYLACYTLCFDKPESGYIDGYPSEQSILRVTGTLIFN